MSFLSPVHVHGRLRGASVAFLLACLALARGARSARADEASPDPADERSPWVTLSTDASPFFTAIGSATSQGVSVLKADQARTIFGVTGAGVKLGVISDSFNGAGTTPTLATQISAGNLPGAGNPNGYTTGVSVVKDDSGTDEGRAMLEIIHDVAPGAQLYFHSAFNNTNPVTSYTGVGTPAPDQSIADAIDGLAAVSGMRVIVDDVGYLTAPRFQDGPAAKSANAAFAKGIAYFSAAGNSATDATRVTTSVGVSGTVNWGTDGLLLMRAAANSSGRAVLQWGEPYTSVSGSATTSNFRVAVTTTNGASTYFTIDNQTAGQDPYEFVTISNSGTAAVDVALRVTRLSGTAPVVMQLSTFGSSFTIIDTDKTNAPTVYGQAAATGAIGVAASYWGTPSSVESFSSRGPTLILFDANGNPVTETRTTPLLTAPDGGTTTTSGFNPFYGTSAAAPHAAAVAALVMERFDQKGLTYSTRDVYQVLYDSAVDIGTAGLDSASGYGRIDALAAVGAGRIWDGNGSTAGVAGSGTWSRASWTLEAAGDKPTGKFIRGQQAIFGSGTAAQSSYSIVVDGTYDVAGLSFVRDTVTLSSGSGTLRLTAPTIDVASGLTATVAASLTGSSGIVKTGAGALRITGSAGYTGATMISAGTLLVGHTFALGGTTGQVTINGGTFDVQTYNVSVGPLSGSVGAVITTATTAGARTLTTNVGSGTSVFAGAIQNGGPGVMALTKAGAGTLVLTGSNGFTGVTTISAGTLRVGDGATSGRLTSGTIANNGTLVYHRSDDYGGPVANVISGGGALTLAGGTLTLTAASPFSGVTTVDAGTLRVNGSLASSAVVVNTGGQLAGSGAVGALTLNAGSTLTPGTSPGTLTAGDVIFNGGGAYNWELVNATGTAGVQWDLLSSSGSLTINATTGNPFAINLWTLSGTGPDTSGPAANFNQYASYSWTIGTFAGGISGFDSTLFSVVTGPANGTGGFANPFVGTFSITTVGNELDVVYTAPTLATYDYTGGTGSFSDGAKWSVGVPPAGTPVIAFSGAGGTVANDLLAAVNALTFTGSASGSYVVTGSSLGVGYGGVVNDSPFTQTIQSPLTLAAAGSVAANAGGLVLSGGVDTAGYGLAVGGNADTTITALSGAGGLSKSGRGTLTLSGSNSFTGGLTLAGGRLVTGDPLALGGTANAVAVNAGTLDLGTVSITIGALSGSAGGVITTATDAGIRMLSTVVASGSATYAGALRDNGTGILGLTKSGPGTLVLSGSSAYSGGTTLSGGTLAVGNAAALGGARNPLAVTAGTLDVGTSSVAVGAFSGSTGAVVTTAATAGTRTLTTTVAAGTSTYAGALRDNGVGKLALVKSGSGMLVLSGSNAATGGLIIAAGTLQVGHTAAVSGTGIALAVNAGTLNTGTFNVAVGALSGSAGGVITTATTAGTRTLTTNVASGSSIFAGSLQNSGSGVLALTKTGGGTLVVSGSNVNTGATTISAGTLRVGAGGTSGRLGEGTITNNGGLVFDRSDDHGGAVANAISGTGSLTLARGSLTLSGSTSFTGDTRATSGTLTLTNARALGGSTLDLNSADNGFVALSGTGVQTYVLGGLKGARNLDIAGNSLSVGGNNQSTTYSGAITGSGAIVKAGFGGLTLSGSHSYSGVTTISGGTLQIGAGGTAGSLGSGAIVNNATLAFNRSDNYGGPFASAISGSGSLRLMSGSLTLTGSNGSTGSTTISAGTLQVGNGGTSGSLGTGPITNNASLVFNRSDAYGGPLASSISGTGATQIMRGTLVVTGSNSSTGPTTISGGVLQVGNGGTAGRLGGGAITNNGALVFNRTDGYGGTVTNAISGSGSLTIAGGTLALGGNNTFTGVTRVAGGVLSLATTQALAGSTLDMLSTDSGFVALSAGTTTQTYAIGGLSGSRNVAIGGNTLSVGGNNQSTTYTGSITGSGGLMKVGTGTFTMTGSNSYSGVTTIAAGRLVGTTASLSGSIAPSSSMPAPGTTVEFAQVTNGTFAGRIRGGVEAPLAIVKSGSGTLTLAGAIIDNATVAVNGGRLVLTSSNVQNGSLTNNAAVEFAQVASGTLFGYLSGSGSLLKTGNGTLTLQAGLVTGTTTVSGGRIKASAATIRGPIVNDAAFEFAQASHGEYAAVVTGTGTLTKSGTGTLLLTGTSLVAGSTFITGGILATGGAERLADTSTVSISSGATFRLGGDETIGTLLGSGSVNLQSSRLTIAGSGSSSFFGGIFGAGGLTKGGVGTLTLGGTNGFLGATNLNAGTLVLSSSAALSTYTTLSIAAGSTLVVNRDVRIFAYTNAGGTISGTGRLLTSATAATGGTLTALADTTGTDAYAVGLLKTSTATLVVSGSTSFTGGVVVEQGIVKLDAGGSFAATNLVDVRGGATLDLNGQAQTVAALAGSGSVALGGGTLTVAAATNTTFAGAIDGGALVKSGSSALNLTGSASVTTAAVTSGLMSVNGTLSGTVAVAPGGTLGGAGTIIGSVSVSGTHAPGNSPDVSTILGNLAYATGATVVWEIGANDATQGPAGARVFDQIVVNGDLTFSGSTTLMLSFFDQDPNSSWTSSVDWGDDFWSANRAWRIYQVSGATEGFANLSLRTESWLDSNGVAFDVARANHTFSLALDGSDVMLVYAVPEPGTLVLLASAGICLLAARRRRRAAHQGLCHSPQAAR
ncbi:MAG: autotransporter-associated beta strand repeat-containing protein [Planctomycetaceae bacterium]